MKKKNIHTIQAALVGACGLLACACGSTQKEQADAYRQYGITCLESGKYEDAIEAFQNSLNESIGHVGEKEIDTCFYKARAQYLSGAVNDALDTYAAVIEYNGDGRAYYLRGNLYFEMGEEEKAFADYKTAVEEDGKNYQLYIGIYEMLTNHDREEEGQKYLSQALEIKSDKPEDALYKGRICYLLGDYSEAVTYLKKAVENEQALAPYYLGQAYEAQGDAENAAKYIRQYLDSGVATSYDLYELGKAEMAEGDYEGALVYYNAGLDMKSVPNKQNLMRSAIAAYEYKGDFKSAKRLAQEYVELYPSDEEMAKENTFLSTR